MKGLEHVLVVGVPDALTALMAKRAGFSALYLSGGGVANIAFGLPDEGLTCLEDVVEETRRIRGAVSLPLLVDADTGWEDPAVTTRVLEEAGATAIHLEDQVPEKKRCGHLAGKELVSKEEMGKNIAAAATAKKNRDFWVIARTDALSNESLEEVIARAKHYKEAGADVLFLEAVTDLTQYQRVKEEVGLPLLANLTEFGVTPSWSAAQVFAVGVDFALYPRTLSRVMARSGWEALQTLKKAGEQSALLERMQTREELYRMLEERDGGKSAT